MQGPNADRIAFYRDVRPARRFHSRRINQFFPLTLPRFTPTGGALDPVFHMPEWGRVGNLTAYRLGLSLTRGRLDDQPI